MSDDALNELVSEVHALISIPDVGFKVREMLADPNVKPADVALVIERDPALTAALLRVSNSVLISRGKPVENVRRAITRLGSLQVQELAMGISVSRAFSGLPGDQVSVSAFWQHSVYTASISRMLAYLLSVPDKEQAFSAGLLHDIGELVIYSRRRNHVPPILRLLKKFAFSGLTHYRAEQLVLEYDHMMVGDLLAKKWALPPSLRQCISNHHQPDFDGPLLPIVVYVSDLLAIEADLDSVPPKFLPPIASEAFEALRLDQRDIPDVLEAVRAGISDMMVSFRL